MQLGLCQINPTVGDLDGNTVRIADAAERATALGAQLNLFCELTLTGYPPADLLDRPGFVADNHAALEALAQRLRGQAPSLVGFVDRCVDDDGHPQLYNALGLLADGQVQQTFHKRLLPSYDVFDETRYFRAGERPLTFELQGVRVGVTICEDAWNAVPGPLRRRYRQDPVAMAVAEGAELIVNAAASPFTLAKHAGRAEMLGEIAGLHGRPLAFVNLVGANDDLVFDGDSALFCADGARVAAGARFAEDVRVASVEVGAGSAPSSRAAGAPVAPVALSPAQAVHDALVLGTRDYARKCGFTRAVLGLSGGIDSALVACIAAEALGPAQVLGVAMPTRYSSEGSLHDAEALAKQLGIGYRVTRIDDMFQSCLDGLTPTLEALGPAPAQDTTFENIQARIRGITLMAISNRMGHLLLTTGNKSEVAVGYCTLYGDMAGGLAVISDLPKTFVYELCREFNARAGRTLIPQSIIDKPPSAELRPDQTDQDSLPPYDVLDAILEQLVERHRSVPEVIAMGHEQALVERIARLVRNTEYKRRQMPPGLIVTSKAFGPGRRMPIAQRYGR